MNKIIVFAFAALVLASPLSMSRAADVAANDWPQFRGPHRDDVSAESGLLKEWPAAGPAVAWKATGIGSGYSTVSIAGGKIFTMGDKRESSYVYALDMTGKPLWNAKVGKPGAQYPGTRCTPTVDGDLLYALGQFGDFVCLQAADGKEVWRKNFQHDLSGGEMPRWSFAESPLVDGDMVICTPGGAKGTLIALNKKTGATIWQSSEITDPAGYSSVIAADIGGVHQFIQLTPEHVFAVDAKNGKLLWNAPRHGDTAVIPTPICFENFVFVTSGYGIGDQCFKIEGSAGSFKAEQVYAKKDMVNHHGGVVRVGDYVYGHSDRGGWTCLELKTGTVKWQERAEKGSLTYADGHLYLRSERGPISLIEATPAGFKQTGHFIQPERSHQEAWPHPVVCGGKLYIRDQDNLFCYDVKAK